MAGKEAAGVYILGLLARYWLVVSTNRMPLLTTIPTSMRKPMREGILSVTPDRNISPNEPTRLNGIQIITMSENRGDSNCIAITRKTSSTAAAIAVSRDCLLYTSRCV